MTSQESGYIFRFGLNWKARWISETLVRLERDGLAGFSRVLTTE